MIKKVYNFYAGPATLPKEILIKAQKNLLNFDNTGISLMEISQKYEFYIWDIIRNPLRHVAPKPALYYFSFDNAEFLHD